MTQSTPSYTAFATSVISARVGRGLLIMDSSIWVAQMTNLPAMLALVIIIFCATGTYRSHWPGRTFQKRVYRGYRSQTHRAS